MFKLAFNNLRTKRLYRENDIKQYLALFKGRDDCYAMRWEKG